MGCSQAMTEDSGCTEQRIGSRNHTVPQKNLQRGAGSWRTAFKAETALVFVNLAH